MYRLSIITVAVYGDIVNAGQIFFQDEETALRTKEEIERYVGNKEYEKLDQLLSKLKVDVLIIGQSIPSDDNHLCAVMELADDMIDYDDCTSFNISPVIKYWEDEIGRAHV